MTGKEVFGTVDGEEVYRITISANGFSACILTYGATLQSLKVPFGGSTVDVVLGYDSLEEYMTRSGRLGAVMGRSANRISHGRLVIDGKVHPLTLNRGEHHIHGGNKGFDKKLWRIEEMQGDSVTLSLESPDGEEGYPGNQKASVTYSITENGLMIEYSASSDETTIFNPTSHAYFNLDGKGTVDGHTVTLHSDSYTPTDADGIPTGKIETVEGTKFNLTRPRLLSEMFRFTGFDNNYILKDKSFAAQVRGSNGLVMTVYTDMPALQFYTAEGLKETPGKNGTVYGKRSGLCLETQFCPDTPNHPNFPQCFLEKDEEFSSYTEFRFS